MVFFASFAECSAAFAVKVFTAKAAKHTAKNAKKTDPEGAGGNAGASRFREKPLERKQPPGFSRLSVLFSWIESSNEAIST
jgi:hypothetical protein